MGIFVGIVLLSILMIVHELGHFLTGLKLGFRILEFSLFMGPVLYSRERNGIRYSIKLLPIGASVRFAGEEDEEMNGLDPRDPGLFSTGRAGPGPSSSAPVRLSTCSQVSWLS